MNGALHTPRGAKSSSKTRHGAVDYRRLVNVRPEALGVDVDRGDGHVASVLDVETIQVASAASEHRREQAIHNGYNGLRDGLANERAALLVPSAKGDRSIAPEQVQNDGRVTGLFLLRGTTSARPRRRCRLRSGQERRKMGTP